MGMALTGVTHCAKCRKSLDIGEYYICKKCQEEERIKKEEEKRRIESKKEEELLIQKIKKAIIKDLAIPIQSDKKDISNSVHLNIVNKSKHISYDQWYAEIGYLIVSNLQKGYNDFKIDLINKEKNK